MVDTTARIVLTAEDKTAAALASLRAGLSGAAQQVTSLQGAFANLLPAVTFTAGFAFVKNINDGVDALNDFKDATGASIENASALEDIAVRTGTAFATVTNATVRFNQALVDSATNQDVAAVFKDLGLSVEELKRIDPAEALRRTAVALAGFADDGDKARRTQELFGRSLKEVAPFLNDLATQTELVGTVTAAQAAEAEKFNRELFALQKNATDAGRALTGDLVKGLNEAAKAFREGGFFEGLQTLLTGNDEFKASKTLAQDTEKLQNLQNAISQAKASGAKDDGRIISNLRAQKEQTEENIKATLRYLKVLRGEISLTGAAPAGPDNRPSIGPGAGGGGTDKVAQKRVDEARKEAEMMSKAQDAIIAAKIAPLVVAAEAQVNFDFELTEKRARDLIADNDAAFEDFRDKFKGYSENITDTTTRSMRELDSAARDIGFTFSSAFEDAVIGGESFRNVLQGIGDDIARIILRRQVTEPLEKAVSGIDFGSLFTANAKGGVYVSPSLSSFSGGVYSTPQVFAFAKGMGIFAEAGPEAIMPLARTSSGELGVRAMAGGGGANVVVNVIEAPGRGGEQSSRQEGDTRFIEIFVEQVESRMASSVQRGDGPLPAAMERTYGLSRAPGTY